MDKDPWPIDRQREDDSPTIEEGHLKDDYARSEQEAVEQALEFMNKTAELRDVNDTASLRDYQPGSRKEISLLHSLHFY